MKLLEALYFAFEIKSRECREKTVLDYGSYLNRFAKYWVGLGKEHSLLEDFTKQDAITYLDYVFTVKKISAVTRNNHFRKLRAMFYVLVERDLIQKNPFTGVKKLRTEKKKRRTFTPTESSIICNYLKDTDKGLLLAVSLCYYCALRNAELRRLKIEDISLEKGIITLDGARTKNKNLANITIPNHLIGFLKEIRLKKYPAHYFVFGPKLQPSEKQAGKNKITSAHKEVINTLTQFGVLTDSEHKTFYSWKDTAARDMIEEGISAPALMKHFRHASLETTQRYLESFGVKNERIKDIKRNLF